MWKRKTPGDDQPRVVSWSYEKFKTRTSFNAWLVGTPEWVLVHHQFVSIPCFHELTDGGLDCPWCLRVPKTAWLAYVPLFEESGKPVVVGVRDHQRKVLSKIRVFQPVRVSKGKDKFDSVAVLPNAWGEPYKPDGNRPWDPIDLRPWLLRLWGKPDLTKWIEDHRGDSGQTATYLPPTRVPRGPESLPAADPPPAELVSRVPLATAGDGAAELSAIVDKIKGRLTHKGQPLSEARPSRNGSHPPPPAD